MIELSPTERKIIEGAIRDIPDFPKPGIMFKDITTLLNDKEAYGVVMNHLYTRYKEYILDFVA
jgi:adenine phosphoribosyltransferase